jgi:hypothetical protein
MKLWLVLHMPTTAREEFAIVGVFDKYDAALNACTLPNHIVGPIMLNENYSTTQYEWWPGAEYPMTNTHAIYEDDISSGSGSIGLQTSVLDDGGE